MDNSALLIVAGVVAAAFAVLFVATTTIRRDRRRAAEIVEAEIERHEGREVEKTAELARREERTLATDAPPPPPRYLDEDLIAISRRQFLNRGIVGAFGFGLAAFGAASIGFLWPSSSGGFGSKFLAGKASDLLASIRDKREPVYNAEGRYYLVPYPEEAVGKAKGVELYDAVVPGMEAGFVALYQKCVHLGCLVPWCKSAQWFECPCHGSQYNRVGEKKGGPAPRGLDRFVIIPEGDSIFVDTGQLIPGPPIGTNTTGQEAEGPHCV